MSSAIVLFGRNIVHGTLVIGVAIVLVALVGAWLLWRRSGSGGPTMSGRWPILAIFILSGAAGLIYEVVWARQLVLVFGNTTQAVSAILTGFFGGIAIGSVIGGRIADRARRALRMYGLLELILVVVVLLTPTTFRLLHDVYRGFFETLEGEPTVLALIRFGLALLALGPATILMGATLPTLTRHLARDPANLATSFGRLYAANTAGAIVGTIAAGIVLIELLGLTGTLLVGASCSAIAGVSALILDQRRGRRGLAGPTVAPDEPTIGADGPVPGPGVTIRPRVRLALIVAFVSGLTSLGYQVLWIRLLASGTGDSTYVFTTILAIFLIGLALGAVAFNVYRTRIQTIKLLAIGQVFIALLALAGMVLVIDHENARYLALTTSFRLLFTQFAGPVAIVVLPATFVMGLTFPAASALIADPEGHVGGNSGLLLSANTLGAISGTFLIPFVVIPLVGSPVALGLIALVNLALGIALAFGTRIEDRLPRLVTGGGGVVMAAVLVVALAGGTIFVDPNIAEVRAGHGTILKSAEDDIASVQAGTFDGAKQLWVTGTSMTALTVDVKLMPILPLILRPSSASDLTVAFGMGSAWRAALIAGLSATAVELVPSVPGMFGFFYPDAPEVLANPAGNIIIADGRNHVELTTATYDIIVVDPPPPIETSGVSVISSLEFYQAAKARLNPGGVMMQWIPFGQDLDEFKDHVRTYASVFPHVIIAFGPGGNGMYMLGSDQPIAFDPAAIESVLARPGVVEDLSSAVDSPDHDLAGWVAKIPQLVWLQGDQVTRFAGSGPLVTDDHP
ncbi:MAG: fused MFS/spermidine synthase, partial [Candidatus Limnocylindrales bacterium]